MSLQRALEQIRSEVAPFDAPDDLRQRRLGILAPLPRFRVSMAIENCSFFGVNPIDWTI